MVTRTRSLTEDWLKTEFTKQAHARDLIVQCPGGGNVDAKIAIVSDYPGEQEVAQHSPLVGSTGSYAWSQLRAIGVHRKDCYVTNLSKRIPDFDSKTKTRSKIPKDEMEQWSELLHWELSQLPNLQYIFVMGGHALYGITGGQGIGNWRGTVCDTRIRERILKCVITYNPAYINSDPRVEPVFKFDVHKLKLVIDGKYKHYRITAHYNPTFDEAMSWIEMFKKSETPVAFDIETIGGELACIGFANNGHEGYCINFRDRETHRFTLEQEITIRIELQKLFDVPGARFIAQNGNFDSYFLWFKDRIRVPKVWFDTLLAHHTLYPRLPHGLGFLTSMYTTHPFYKDEGDEWKEATGDISSFWEYNVKDCCITWECHRLIKKELEEAKLDKFFFGHVMRLQPHLTHMTVSGIALDTSLREQIAEELIADTDKQLREFWELARELTGEGPDYCPNPRSTKQMQGLLFDRLKLVGHGRANDKANRARIKSHSNTSEYGAELIDRAERYIKDAKFLSTSVGVERDDQGNLVLKDKLDWDNRGRCEYKQYGTQAAPGRLSSTQTLWGTGWNLQNVPVNAYKMFIADPGYEFTYFDKRQAEAKCVAYMWDVPGLKRNFIRSETEDGFDLHRGNASMIFKVPYDQIPTKDYDEQTGTHTLRYLGKRCVHGLNYRMSPSKLAETCKIPLEQAFEAYQAYHRTFPEIRKAWDKIVRRVMETRMMFNCIGRRLIILERLDENSLDSVVAFEPQSTIGDSVSAAIYKSHEHPDWPTGEARMVLNIHDALVCMHKPQHRDVVTGIMREVSQEPLHITDIHGREHDVIIFSDFKHSEPDEQGVHRWSSLK